MDTKRPISISIIGWFLIVGSALGMISAPFSFNSPLTQQLLKATGASPSAVLLLGLFGGIVGITAGAAMLRGLPWGRRLYLIATPVVLIVSIVIYGVEMLGMFLIGIVTYAAFFVLLTRRDASDYFSGVSVTTSPAPPGPSPALAQDSTNRKRIVSVVLLVPGGLILNAWFMILLPMAQSSMAVVVVSCIFGLLAGAFVIPAILLWGRKRWAVVLGTLLTSVGGMLLMTAFMFYQFTTMAVFREQFAKIDPLVIQQMIRGSLMFGIEAAVIGVLLIIIQRSSDQRPKETTAMRW